MEGVFLRVPGNAIDLCIVESTNHDVVLTRWALGRVYFCSNSRGGRMTMNFLGVINSREAKFTPNEYADRVATPSTS
jgi:hypothetical protein